MESDQLESSRNLDPVAGATDGSPTQQQELLMDEKVEPPPRKATEEEPYPAAGAADGRGSGATPP